MIKFLYKNRVVVELQSSKTEGIKLKLIDNEFNFEYFNVLTLSIYRCLKELITENRIGCDGIVEIVSSSENNCNTCEKQGNCFIRKCSNNKESDKLFNDLKNKMWKDGDKN